MNKQDSNFLDDQYEDEFDEDSSHGQIDGQNIDMDSSNFIQEA
jgi:hypothetical protein